MRPLGAEPAQTISVYAGLDADFSNEAAANLPLSDFYFRTRKFSADRHWAARQREHPDGR